MIGLIIKLAVYPIVLTIAHSLLPQVQFEAMYQIILVSVVLAAIAHYAELIFLNYNNSIFSTGMDFGIAAVILWLSRFTFPGIVLSLNGAVITAAVLAGMEYLQHRWLLANKKVKIK